MPDSERLPAIASGAFSYAGRVIVTTFACPKPGSVAAVLDSEDYTSRRNFAGLPQ